jgi:peptidoglycan/LPS O-acetylase OafA/YrhL
MLKTDKFEALDGLRGVCACLVALHHFEAKGPITESLLIRQSWIFVDFFFVLSGFIIAYKYFQNLSTGRDLFAFALRRFARLYPLHIFILSLMIGLEFINLKFSAHAPGAFFTEKHSVFAIFTNALMVQTLNLHPKLTWNGPSWSISAEWWTYLLFGLICYFLSPKTRRMAFVSLALLGALIFLLALDTGLNVHVNYGLVRCVLGFSMGVICYCCRAWIVSNKPDLSAKTWLSSGLELLIGVAIIGFCLLPLEGKISVAAPFLFAVAVMIFSFENGPLSSFLKSKPLQVLGMLSFSIYMVHWLVQSVIYHLVSLSAKRLNLNLWDSTINQLGEKTLLVGRTALEGSIAHALALGLVIFMSYFTYRFVERPGRSLAQRYLASRDSQAQ